MEHKPNYDALVGNLAHLAEIIRALRNQEVDAIVGTKNVFLLRLKEAEKELKKQRNHLEELLKERTRLLEDSKINQVKLETQAKELNRNRQEAQESRDRYQDLYDYAPVGYLTLGKRGNVVEANLTAARMLGTERSELTHSQFTRFIAPDSKDEFYSYINQILETGTNGHCEVKICKRDGSVFYAQIEGVSRHSDTKPNSVRLILSDVTERKKAEEGLAKAKDELEIRVKERTRELALANEQLRQYSYRITQIQEEERKRIAYELGEELAQTLASIKMDADLMTEKVSSSLANVNSHVDSIREKMSTVLRTAINFSNELRPSVLGNLGLPDALQVIIEEMNRNRELQIVLKTNGAQRRLHEKIETALFRIAQEAINNIIRHSGATKAEVNVRFLKTGVKLTIIDNGKGFDTERKLDLKDAHGLISIRERAHQIGGELKIKSELGKGTIITVTVPSSNKSSEQQAV